jgi:transposase
MTKQRKKFDTHFKLEVVHMIQELHMIQGQGLSVHHVSQSMRIGLTAIRRWVTQYKAEQSGQRGIGNPLTAEQ